jgi:hypothetical protein
MWDKILSELKAERRKNMDDLELVSFIYNVEGVKQDVKNELFRYIIGRASHKYGLAFT